MNNSALQEYLEGSKQSFASSIAHFTGKSIQDVEGALLDIYLDVCGTTVINFSNELEFKKKFGFGFRVIAIKAQSEGAPESIEPENVTVIHETMSCNFVNLQYAGPGKWDSKKQHINENDSFILLSPHQRITLRC